MIITYIGLLSLTRALQFIWVVYLPGALFSRCTGNYAGYRAQLTCGALKVIYRSQRAWSVRLPYFFHCNFFNFLLGVYQQVLALVKVSYFLVHMLLIFLILVCISWHSPAVDCRELILDVCRDQSMTSFFRKIKGDVSSFKKSHFRTEFLLIWLVKKVFYSAKLETLIYLFFFFSDLSENLVQVGF